MKSMLKTLSLLMAALLLLGLFVGCSQTPGAEPDADPAEEPDTAPEQATTENPEPVESSGETEKTPFQLHISEIPKTVSYTRGGKTWAIPDVANDGTGGLTLPLAQNDETLRVYRSFVTFDHSISTPDENIATHLIEEKTGVKVEWETYSNAEQFNLMVVSQDYADMIWASTSAYTGGVDKAVEDEVYVNGYPYLELMPNYVCILESDATIYRSSVTDSHNLYFTTVNSGSQGSFASTMVRTDWLEECGLDIPVTYDDWYEMLVAFRDQKNASDPLHVLSTGAFTSLTAGYGTMAGFYAKNGTEAVYGYIDDGMKDYVAMMQKWYAEDLVYHDYLNDTDPMSLMGLFTSGASGATDSGYFGYPGMMAGMLPGATFAGAPIPKINVDDENPHLMGNYNGITTDSNIFITTAAVDRGVDELAAQWVDYRYSREGSIILDYGKEGVTYYIGEDGYPMSSEALLSNVVEGVTYEEAGSVWTDSAGGAAGRFYWILRTCDKGDDNTMKPLDVWLSSADATWNMPTVSMTTEEAELYRETYGDIETYVQENFTKFIIGEKSMDEWDEYVATVEGMGIQDCIDCYQSALDRYNAR